VSDSRGECRQDAGSSRGSVDAAGPPRSTASARMPARTIPPGLRMTGWWLAACAAVAGCTVAFCSVAAGASSPTALWIWLCATGTVAGAGTPMRLIRRPGRPVPVRRAMKWTARVGSSVLFLTIAVGALAFSTGLARVYAPPRMTVARLLGTWSDGHGGSVRLAADGKATADRPHPDAEVVGTALGLGKGVPGSRSRVCDRQRGPARPPGSARRRAHGGAYACPLSKLRVHVGQRCGSGLVPMT
jgi:hypothetical protein